MTPTEEAWHATAGMDPDAALLAFASELEMLQHAPAGVDRRQLDYVLCLRDAVTRSCERTPFVHPEVLRRLEVLDVQLGRLARGILGSEGWASVAALEAGFRGTQGWWRRLEATLGEEERPSAPRMMASSLGTFLLVLGVGWMAARIIVRFMPGANVPEVVVALVGAFVGVLAWEMAGDAGRHTVRAVASFFRISARNLDLVGLGLAAALVLGLVGVERYGLPRLALRLHALALNHEYSRYDLHSAIRDFKLAASLDPEMPEAHHDLAHAYEEIGDDRAAIVEYLAAIGADERFGAPRNNLGRLYILLGRYEKAVLVLEELLAVASRDVDGKERAVYHRNLGWAYLELGATGEATRHLREAIRLNPAEVAADCLLSAALESSDDRAIPAGSGVREDLPSAERPGGLCEATEPRDDTLRMIRIRALRLREHAPGLGGPMVVEQGGPR